MKKIMVLLLIMISFSASSSPGAVAVVTELKTGKGAVEIRGSGRDVWKKAQVLQSLEAGDGIRVSGDAAVVILFSGGEGAARITAANSPYEVRPAKTGSEKTGKAGAVMNRVVSFLAGRKSDSLTTTLAVRGGVAVAHTSGRLKRNPAIISPKDTRVISARPQFEWIGTPRIPYRIRVYDGKTIVWEEEDILRARIFYPDNAAALVPGRRYIWEIGGADYPSVQAWFEIAEGAERKELEDEAAIAVDGGKVQGPTSAMMRYGLFVSRGFSSDGRAVLVEAIGKYPDDPALHLLLGDYYESVGLGDLAAEEYDEAQFLLQDQK